LFWTQYKLCFILSPRGKLINIYIYCAIVPLFSRPGSRRETSAWGPAPPSLSEGLQGRESAASFPFFSYHSSYEKSDGDTDLSLRVVYSHPSPPPAPPPGGGGGGPRFFMWGGGGGGGGAGGGEETDRRGCIFYIWEIFSWKLSFSRIYP
jgi:hypothetical protein